MNDTVHTQPTESPERMALHAFLSACYGNGMSGSAMREAMMEFTHGTTVPVRTLALSDVIGERLRQQDAEGWTPEHDDMHKGGQLALAAACYTLASHRLTSHGEVPGIWPWAPSFWKPTYGRRDLVKAGALILAEIERMDRSGQKGGAA